MLHANNMQIAKNLQQEFGVLNFYTLFSTFTQRFYLRCSSQLTYGVLADYLWCLFFLLQMGSHNCLLRGRINQHLGAILEV
jgi:hypothetical protein